MPLSAFNQSLVWGNKVGDSGMDDPSDIVLDQSGNVYSTGYFNGTVDFDPGAGVFNLSSAGQDDVFVLKLDNGGNFLWARRMGGAGDDAGHSVDVDTLGNVYITGSFEGTADFDPGVGTYGLVSSGTNDAFVQRLDNNGNFSWAFQIGGNVDIDAGYALALDDSGNVYITGTFNGVSDFDPGAGTLNLTSGSQDIFILKTDSAGDFIWATNLGGTQNDLGRTVDVDTAGNIFIGGEFRVTVDFDPGPGVFNLTSAGSHEAFVLKLNNPGNFAWAKRFGNTNWEKCHSVAADKWGNVHFTGEFYGTVDFNPGPATYNLSSEGGRDVYVGKLDASGNFLWAVSMGGSGHEIGYALAIDDSGNVYTNGEFVGGDFDPGPGLFELASPDLALADIFVHKMDSSGAFVAAFSLPSTGNDFIGSMAVDTSGFIYVNGGFGGTMDMDPGPATFFVASDALLDIFVTKLSWELIPCVNSTIPVIQSSHPKVCFNAANITLSLVSGNLNDADNWVWYNDYCGGTAIGTGASINVLHDQDRFYFVRGEGVCVNTGSCAGIFVPFSSNIIHSSVKTDEVYGSDGSIDLNVSGGEPPYSYSWTGPAGFTSNDQDLFNLAGGVYIATITDANGCIRTHGATVASQLGITETGFYSEIYPNPSKGIVTVAVAVANAGQDCPIEMYDVAGNRILTAILTENSVDIDLTGLAPGVYVLQITTGESKIVRRLVLE